MKDSPQPVFFDSWDLLDLPEVDSPVRPFPEGRFSLKSLLDSEDDYYDYWTYGGSTTSPPCSHNTKWIVFMEEFAIGLTFLEMVRGSQYTFRE